MGFFAENVSKLECYCLRCESRFFRKIGKTAKNKVDVGISNAMSKKWTFPIRKKKYFLVDTAATFYSTKENTKREEYNAANKK